MSMESEFFGRYRPLPAKMKAAKLPLTEDGYECRAVFFDGQFEARLFISQSGGVSGRVIDLDTGEEFLPIRARNSAGAFTGSVRQSYLQILEQVRDAFFAPVDFLWDQSNRIAGQIATIWGDEPEFPWEKYPGNGTFKCASNQKWYAAVLTVAFEKLTDPGAAVPHEADEVVEVVNLKADPDRIPELIRQSGVCPAWHMNKKHWISVLLDDTLTDEAVMEMVRASRDLVALRGAKSSVTGNVWIIPSNPKVYDIDTEFAQSGGAIEWHQHNNIRAGDEVYIYSAAPNSAILYRCLVEASDLPYHGIFEESKGYTRAMRIRLIESYARDRYPLSFMKANGGSAVRSARRMPLQLLEAIIEDRTRREGKR